MALNSLSNSFKHLALIALITVLFILSACSSPEVPAENAGDQAASEPMDTTLESKAESPEPTDG